MTPDCERRGEQTEGDIFQQQFVHNCFDAEIQFVAIKTCTGCFYAMLEIPSMRNDSGSSSTPEAVSLHDHIINYYKEQPP